MSHSQKKNRHLPKDIITSIAKFIDDSDTWVNLSKCCQKTYRTLKPLVTKKEYWGDYCYALPCGTLHGPTSYYSIRNEYCLDGYYKNDLYYGTCKLYEWRYGKREQLKEIRNYKNGKQHGKQIKFRKDGSRKVYHYSYGEILKVTKHGKKI